MKHCKILFFILTSFRGLFGFSTHAQSDTLRVLFLGNSYTAVNVLPEIVSGVASGKGKTLIYDSNTPGGYSYAQHATNATSLEKIQQGNWDYVVMQEQSQIPVIPEFYESWFVPGGTQLADSIRLYNPCAEIILYMTWGRRFGGMQCDQSGTYCSVDFEDFGHMQDSLTSSYLNLSQMIDAKVAPCGETWRDVIDQTEEVLHTGDNSHPNYTGSYAAACAMFATLWQENSAGSTFYGSLDESLALEIQSIADVEVFEHTDLYRLYDDFPSGSIVASIDNNWMSFQNYVEGFEPIQFSWNFGDGFASESPEPSHFFNQGIYTVTLTAAHCEHVANFEIEVEITTNDLDEITTNDLRITPTTIPNQYLLQLNQFIYPIQVEVFDQYGKGIHVNQKQMTGNNVLIDLQPQTAAGVYLMRIVSMPTQSSVSHKFFHLSR